MRVALIAFSVVAVTACLERSPAGPTIPLGQQFILPRGEAVVIDGTSVRLEFVEVTGDSRCPSDVVCIQGGDAIVHIRASGDGDLNDYALHSGDASRAAVTHRQLRLELVRLDPYPFSTRTIDQGDYRATLKVTAP